MDENIVTTSAPSPSPTRAPTYSISKVSYCNATILGGTVNTVQITWEPPSFGESNARNSTNGYRIYYRLNDGYPWDVIDVTNGELEITRIENITIDRTQMDVRISPFLYDGYDAELDENKMNSSEAFTICSVETIAPTNAPSNSPTSAPTNSPSKVPSDSPSNSPTTFPTLIRGLHRGYLRNKHARGTLQSSGILELQLYPSFGASHTRGLDPRERCQFRIFICRGRGVGTRHFSNVRFGCFPRLMSLR